MQTLLNAVFVTTWATVLGGVLVVAFGPFLVAGVLIGMTLDSAN